MPSLSVGSGGSEESSYCRHYDKIYYKSKAAVGVGRGDSINNSRYVPATSPSSTGGIGITRRLSSAFANSITTTTGSSSGTTAPATAQARTLAGDTTTTTTIGSSAPNTNSNAQTLTMNAPSTGNGSSSSSHSLSISSGNAPSSASASTTPPKASEGRAFLRSESRAYASHSTASDALARLQFLLRTNARTVGAVVAFAFFVVFVLDDDGTYGPGSLRGNL